VERIRLNPLIPADVYVHGLIFHPRSGKVDVVVNGYE
jgi:carbonic anhydrase